MDSERLKIEAMAWLRFGKRMPIVCTEAATYGLADVLGVSPTQSIEIETKISKSDLKRDFTHKEDKHARYTNGIGAATPNYFYILVPEKLAEDAVTIVNERSTKYGVVAYVEGWAGRLGENLKVLHKAQRLHSNKPGPGLIRTAIMRMSSELVGMHQVNQHFGQALKDHLWNLKSAAVKQAYLMAGALDVEETEENYRAAELALAVEGITLQQFLDLPAEQKAKWLAAAEKMRELSYPETWEAQALAFTSRI